MVFVSMKIRMYEPMGYLPITLLLHDEILEGSLERTVVRCMISHVTSMFNQIRLIIQTP